MISNRRGAQRPLPEKVSDYLSAHQQFVLPQIERAGWEISFVRRPRFQYPTVVLRNTDGALGVLEPDGTLNEHRAIDVRN